MLTPLYTPRPDGPMRVAGFISGSGTNLVKILERQAALDREPAGCPYKVVVVFTDSPKSNAPAIGRGFRVPVVLEDILAFYHSRGHATKKDLSLRPDFDRKVVALLATFAADAVVLAGYMSVVTRPLLEAFPGRIINVHPADLTIESAGRRKYTGDHAVRDAILAGESSVCSSTHIVREEVDAGEVLMVSGPVPVELPEGFAGEGSRAPEKSGTIDEIAEEHQQRLKEAGDWVIFPRTLELLARGRYARDERGRIYLDGNLLRDPRI